MPHNQGLSPHYQKLNLETPIPNKLVDHLLCKKMNSPSFLVGALDDVSKELLELEKISF